VAEGSERELSRAAVLRAVALYGPMSRTAIASRLDVSPATVTALTRDLLSDGLVEPAGKEPGTARGRPAELLRVVPGAAVLLGAKVSATAVTGVVADLLGEPLAEFQAPFDADGPDPIGDLVAVFAPQVALAGGSLIGVGLGVPGVVDVAAGRVTAAILGWRDLAVGPELSERLGLPVVVDNDVHTLAIAEHLYGRARDVDDVLTVNVGRGVGLAITLGGRLHRGPHGGAGEFGHTQALENGPRCACGRHGCLEAVASEPAMLRRAHEEGVLPVDGTMGDLRDAAHGGDTAARTIFADAGAVLGRRVGDLVNLLAPSLLLISGEGTASWSLIQPAFETAFDAQVLDTHTDVEVVVDRWDDRAWARGATALVLGSVFAPDHFIGEAQAEVRSRLQAVGSGGDGR
jgi:predicted NBD/HSP70 family sugar kinase